MKYSNDPKKDYLIRGTVWHLIGLAATLGLASLADMAIPGDHWYETLIYIAAGHYSNKTVRTLLEARLDNETRQLSDH